MITHGIHCKPVEPFVRWVVRLRGIVFFSPVAFRHTAVRLWRYANSALISETVFVANRSLCGCVRSQVRFAFELLCSLQPGMPVMALHGKCKHARRTQIYLDFVRRPGAVLLATDIAARGLDFPSVDWVIQVTR